MATFSHALVSRSLRSVNQGFESPYATYRDDGSPPPPSEIPIWIVPALLLTGLVCILSLGAISYTYGLVVPTLAMVEEPEATYIIKTTAADGEHPDDPLLGADDKTKLEQELFLIKSKPITSKLRTTTRHLRQKAGRMARFRGLHVYLILLLAQTLFSEFFMSWLPENLMTRSLVYVASAVVFSRLSMAWTHRVISEPRPDKRWYQRIADRSAARRIVLPTFKFALADMAANMLPLLALRASGLISLLNNLRTDESRQQLATLYPFLAIMGVFLVALAAQLFIYLPASVMLVRTQASLLPEEDEPIVPFDRTYGGKVVPAADGGSGRLEMRDAWRTFDWNARVRLLKIYIKAQTLQCLVVILFEILIAFELYFAFGPQIEWFLQQAARQNSMPEPMAEPYAIAHPATLG